MRVLAEKRPIKGILANSRYTKASAFLKAKRHAGWYAISCMHDGYPYHKLPNGYTLYVNTYMHGVASGPHAEILPPQDQRGPGKEYPHFFITLPDHAKKDWSIEFKKLADLIKDQMSEKAEEFNYPIEVFEKSIELIEELANLYKESDQIDSEIIDSRVEKPKKIPNKDLVDIYRKGYKWLKDTGAFEDGFLEKFHCAVNPQVTSYQDWDDDKYTCKSLYEFIFKSKETRETYKFEIPMYLFCSADGWYDAGSFWEPPDGESWVTDLNEFELDSDGECEEGYAAYCSESPSNPDQELIDTILAALTAIAESSDFRNHIEEDLEDLTGQEVK